MIIIRTFKNGIVEQHEADAADVFSVMLAVNSGRVGLGLRRVVITNAI